MKTSFTTLTTAALAPLLERLYKEADAQSPATSPAVTELSLEERTRLMQSKTDYVALFARLKDFSALRCSLWIALIPASKLSGHRKTPASLLNGYTLTRSGKLET